MRSLVIIFTLLLTLNVSAQNKNSVFRFIEGVDYQLLQQPVKTITGDKIEVTEAFSYLCSHCYNFEPILNEWAKGLADDVELVKLHVVFQPSMKHYAKILYTAKALGIEDKVNPVTFSAIHIQKNRLRNESKVAELFTSLGIKPEDFKRSFKSFGVDKEVRQASARTRAMKIAGTPQMIIDGKYSVTVTRETGHKGMLEVVDYLINKVRTDRAR